MLSSLSSNAILSRARARYGKMLKISDYKNLINCKSVSEIAGYLKNNTDYQSILTGIDENDMHRGQLELLLKQKLFYDFNILCKYELTVGEHFADYIISKNVIEQILHSLVLINSKDSKGYLFTIPNFLKKHSHIDLKQLSRINSYSEILEILKNSEYFNILKPFSPKQGNTLNIPAIENALYTYLFSKAFFITNTYTKGETKKQLINFFNFYADLSNYIKIIRLKTYFKCSSDDLKNTLLLPFGKLTSHQLNAMISANSSSEVINEIKNTYIYKKIQNISYNYIDELLPKSFQKILNKYIHFSIKPPIIILSYLFLSEIEITNIIHIIEGIRYGVDKNDIYNLLILSE